MCKDAQLSPFIDGINPAVISLTLAAMKVQLKPTHWAIVASYENEKTKAATSVATVGVSYAHTDDHMESTTYDEMGPISLQQVLMTQLYRLVLHFPDGRNGVSLLLPIDEPWTVKWTKTKGKTTATGVQVDITFATGSKEGMSKLVIAMPRDPKDKKEEGSSFVLARALVAASKVVAAAVDYCKTEQKAKAVYTEAAKEAAALSATKQKDFASSALLRDTKLKSTKKQAFESVKPTFKSPPPAANDTTTPPPKVSFSSPVASTFQSPKCFGSPVMIDSVWSPDNFANRD